MNKFVREQPEKRGMKKGMKKKRGIISKLKRKRVVKALRESKGLIALAAKQLRVTYHAVYWRIQNDKYIAKKYEAIQEENLDFAEANLLSSIDKGRDWAICFYLKCKGKKRGYIERQELAGVSGQPIEHSVTVFSEKKLRTLSTTELQTLVSLFEKVKGNNGHGSLEKEKETNRVSSDN